MNTFRIEIPYNKLEYINANNIRWEIHSRKRRRMTFVLILIATIILGLGIVQYLYQQRINSLLKFGVFFELYMIVMTIIMSNATRKFKNGIKEDAEELDIIKNNCVYEFSDESIKYWDKETDIELKWEAFTSYCIYKNFLILCIDNSTINSYVFEKKDSEADSFDKIYKIVKSHVNFKRIKATMF